MPPSAFFFFFFFWLVWPRSRHFVKDGRWFFSASSAAPPFFKDVQGFLLLFFFLYCVHSTSFSSVPTMRKKERPHGVRVLIAFNSSRWIPPPTEKKKIEFQKLQKNQSPKSKRKFRLGFPTPVISQTAAKNLPEK